MSVSVLSQLRIEVREKQILIELPLNSRYCAGCFWWVILFNPFDNTVKADTSNYYLHCLDKETKLQRGEDANSRLLSS